MTNSGDAPSGSRTASTRTGQVIITLGVIVLCAAVGFLAVSHYVVLPNGVKVAVVGDSLVAQSTWTIIDELDGHGYTSTVAGVNGVTINDELRQLDSLTIPESSDVLVVALGTNNAFFASIDDDRRRDLDSSKRDVRNAMTHVLDGEPGQSWTPSPKCVVWVNINDASPLLNLDQSAPVLNREIDAAAADHRARGRDVVVADWAGLSRNHGDDWFLVDRVHLTQAGERAYAELIRKSVDDCGKNGPPTAGTRPTGTTGTTPGTTSAPATTR